MPTDKRRCLPPIPAHRSFHVLDVFDGCAVTGWPVVVHGQIAVRDGELNRQPAGQTATFPDTAA
ncbi:hypothetical protein [Burkholderia pyrrocinia]|uniref:hypothetical protein n=1 Tax=Burkholderia pyrrocinia TaxID=60550 RepID=UPI001053A0B9|nr:hypothetical protein [Burkholderia pyrrocinia]TDA43119.1 hypothetical protein EVG18_34380 [Burkholderia pyrrocinia]